MDQWLPLNTCDQQIRLLEVASRERDANSIHCRLVVVSLQSNPTYEALSYVWGGWDDSQEIILNGSKHTVTRNLRNALRVMQYADRPRLLWVDAVCIDQGNLQERTSQVAMMGKIYFQAEQVLVWLGESRKHDLSDGVLAHGKDASKHYDEPPFELMGLNVRFDTWWYRAWTYQEAALAKRLIFHSGDHTFTDQDLEGYVKSARLHLFNANGCCQYILKKGASKHIARTAFSGPFLLLEHVLDSRSLRTHRTENLLSIVLDNSIRSATDPRDLVHAFIGLAIDAPCDLIRYDLPLKEWVVHVTKGLIDHSRSLDAIRYVTADEMTQVAPLKHHRVQRGVEEDWLRMQELPSWCPDWTQTIRLRHFEAKSQRRLILKDRFKAARGTVADVQIQNSTVLQASGALVDTVSLVGKVSDHFQGPKKDCFLQWCWLVANSHAIHEAFCDGCDMTIYGIRHKCMVCMDFDLCPVCFVKAKEKHPDHAFEHLRPGCSAAKSGTQETGNSDSVISHGLTEVPDITVEKQGNQYCVSGSVWEKLDKVRYPFAESSTLQDAFRNTLLAGTSALEVFEKIKVLPIYEEVAFTEWWQGTIEELPFVMFHAKHGFSQEDVGEILDSVSSRHVSLIGSLVQMIVQDSTLIVGEEGYIGWGSKEIQVGDMVTVLKGGDTPFILRGVADSCNTGDEIHCTLVGEAYVHGLMDGEAIQAEQRGLLQTQKFSIH